MRKMFSLIFAGIFSLALSLTLSSNFCRMQKTTTALKADASGEFLDGDGTDESPFLISSKNHLLNIPNHLDAHYRLVSNIKILDSDYEPGGIFYKKDNSKFLPIGSGESPFAGTFDGNNFTVDNLKISNSSMTKVYAGFFGNTQNAVIKNLNFTNYLLDGSDSRYVGGVVGYGVSTSVVNCNVKSGELYSISTEGTFPAGVICGFLKDSNVTKCNSKINVTRTFYTEIGGIVGRAENTKIFDCINESVFSDSPNSWGLGVCGGICGRASSNSSITSCVNKGLMNFGKRNSGIVDGFRLSDITYGSNASGGIVGILSSSTVSKCSNLRAFEKCPYAGGIVGCSMDSSEISYCSNTVDVDGSCSEIFTYLGGIVAVAGGPTTITCCYNTGNVVAKVRDIGRGAGFAVGGVCGFANSRITIKDCYNTGYISCYNSDNGDNYEQSSGVLGAVQNGPSSNKPTKANILNCFSIGHLGTENATYVKRAIIGSPIEGAKTYITFDVTNCFYVSNDADFAYSSQVTGGISYDAFKSRSTFAGFDFASVWCFDIFSDYEHPILQYFDINSIENVEIIGNPELQVLENCDLDLTSYSLSAKNQSNVYKSIPFEQDFIYGYDKNKIGVQKVYAWYRGVKSTNYLSVTVVRKSITSISINKNPEKLQYLFNEEDLDLTGGKINIYYDNGTVSVADMSRCDISGFDNTVFGEQTITLTYLGFQTSFTINVYKIASISLSKLPSKTTFVLGQKTDFSTGTLLVNYTNGDKREIPLENSFCSFDTSLTGTVPVSVEYGGLRCEFNIMVDERIIDYFELIQPKKLIYYVGEGLDLTDGCLRIVFKSSDNYTEYVNLDESMISGFDTTTAGIKTLTVKYGEIEDTFVISVKNLYSVTFVDYDGTVISADSYHYGDPVSVPPDPARPSDGTYAYAFEGWDKPVSATCTGNATYTARYSSEYSDEYRSGLLRNQLISEIDGITKVDLSTHSIIADIQSRMEGLTTADRMVVEQKLNGLIERYNSFVDAINNEYDVSEEVFDDLFSETLVAIGCLAYGLMLVIKRRFLL